MKFDTVRIQKFSDVIAAVAWSPGCLSPTLKTLGFSFIKRDTVISLRQTSLEKAKVFVWKGLGKKEFTLRETTFKLEILKKLHLYSSELN